VWTTTPWTLVSNVAIAVHPDVTYVVATDGAEKLIVAESLVDKALGEGWTATGASFVGKELERWTYQRPFDLVAVEGAHYIVLAAYVTTEDGSGLVHQAPAFGADDLAVSRQYGLPMVNPLRRDGTFDPSVPLVGGAFFKAADDLLVSDLHTRGLLLRKDPYEHSYPHCWRCHTPLVYYAQPSWYVRTTAVRDAMLRENEATSWQPETVKHGRYGD
jgi:isoleucyl-tRNA synthetase